VVEMMRTTRVQSLSKQGRSVPATRLGRPTSTRTSTRTSTPTVAQASRTGTVKRETKETKINLTINIDGTGKCHSKSQIPFLDHMMDQLASHGLFDVHLEAEGDTWIDDHHTNEDIALALGTALSQALGDRKGINRFGCFSAPLDEALVEVVLDLSGRPHLSCSLDLPTERIGTYETQLVEHFFQSLVNTSGMTLHIRQLDGKNSHHLVEATFKAFARALRIACEVDERRAGTIASSKGVLTQS
jgi:imidazoleglycerol-phosphate dehydratase